MRVQFLYVECLQLDEYAFGGSGLAFCLFEERQKARPDPDYEATPITHLNTGEYLKPPSYKIYIAD